MKLLRRDLPMPPKTDWSQYKAKGGGNKWSQYKASSQPQITENTPEEQASTGWGAIGHDIAEKSKATIFGIPKSLQKEQFQGIKEQAQNEPSRIAKNLAAGLGEGAIGLLNSPHDLLKYLGEKKVIPEALKNYNELPFTHIPDLGIEEKMGLGEEKPGDALTKLIPQLIGAGGVKKTAEHGMPIPHSRILNKLESELAAIKESEKMLTQHHKQFLGEGQEHPARASQQFVDFIEGKVNPETNRTEGGLRREVGSQYEKLTNDLANERVQIEQTPDLKAIQKSMQKLGGGVSGAEKEKLMKILTSADSKLKTVSGADALTTYRELKRQKSKSFQRAYEPGIGPKEHEEWIKKGEELGSLEGRMRDMLEKQIGGKYLERLKTIDKAYATKIAPLSENSMYQEMLKHGQTSKNIMKYLHGKTKGNETLNAIVEKDPELQRVIIGQQFAAKPEKLAQDAEVLEKYKKMNPLISKMVEELKGIKHTKENVIPHLEETIKKTQGELDVKKSSRKSVHKLAGYGALAAAAYAAENALSRDWKQDIPLLTSLLTLNKIRKLGK